MNYITNHKWFFSKFNYVTKLSETADIKIFFLYNTIDLDKFESNWILLSIM